MIEPRWYQSGCVEAVYQFLRTRSGNPCGVLPTGSGKTPVIAILCRDAVVTWEGRVLVLAHVKELLEQTADKLRAVCPEVPIGVYSAGLKRRDTTQPVIVAGIQSVHDKAAQLGRFDLVIIDEAHLIPASGDGMYRKLIAALIEINPDLRVIGLTATPYRLGSGPICGPDNVLTEVCYEVGVKPLINQGFLSPLVGKAAVASVDTSAFRLVRGEFADDQAGAAFTADGEVLRAVREIVERTADRKSTLLFCQTVAHARQVAAALRAELAGRTKAAEAECEPAREAFGFGDDPLASPDLPVWADWLEEHNLPCHFLRRFIATGRESVGEVYGDTKDDARTALLDAFKAGRLPFLVNVNVLTTGFDAPNVDCVVLLRATASPGLYYQMVGRGFRLSPGKLNCLVLDYGENIVRHGPVDCIRSNNRGGRGGNQDREPAGKVCPECRTVAAGNAAVCLECGFSFAAQIVAPAHTGEASGEDPVSGPPKTERKPVTAVTYRVHTKKGAGPDAPKTLRVTYQTGFNEWTSEWVCVEHPAGRFAHRKAKDWWKLRCRFPMPASAVEAAVMAEHGLFARPATVDVKTDAKKEFPEITDVELDDVPDGPEPCPECGGVNLRCIVRHDEPRYPGRVICYGCEHPHGYADPATCERFGFLDDPGRTQFGGLLPAEWFPKAGLPAIAAPAPPAEQVRALACVVLAPRDCRFCKAARTVTFPAAPGMDQADIDAESWWCQECGEEDPGVPRPTPEDVAAFLASHDGSAPPDGGTREVRLDVRGDGWEGDYQPGAEYPVPDDCPF